MTPVEIIALIVAIAIAVKILVILINPGIWMQKVVRPVYGRPILTTTISIILAAVVLNYLLAEITIVQIFAVMGFLALIIAIGALAYSNELLAFAEKMLKDKAIIKKAWISILIWIALTIWVLYTLLI
tara:strand:+ start:902 stop:1285 length:384 start_codon:yes stop_codon:yes gene_type:complete